MSNNCMYMFVFAHVICCFLHWTRVSTTLFFLFLIDLVSEKFGDLSLGSLDLLELGLQDVHGIFQLLHTPCSAEDGSAPHK